MFAVCRVNWESIIIANQLLLPIKVQEKVTIKIPCCNDKKEPAALFHQDIQSCKNVPSLVPLFLIACCYAVVQSLPVNMCDKMTLHFCEIQYMYTCVIESLLSKWFCHT